MLGVALNYRCLPEANNNPWKKSLNTIGIANVSAGDKLHHKFTLVDRQTVISGSQNWSAAANNINDETLIIIDNFRVAKHFEREFQRLYQSVNLELNSKIETKLNQQKQDCY